jgi:hypothetical protein
VSLIFSTKTPVGKIENMTHAYVNITSLKTLIRNLVSKTYQRKEYNMMLVQVFRGCLPLILANLEVSAYQFHVPIFETQKLVRT